MSQRPRIQKPTPLAQPATRPAASADPFGGAAGGGAPDVVMGGVNIPQFSKDMQAEISPEAAPLWNFVTNHAPKIAAAVVAMVVIILAIAGWRWYVEKGLREAQGQLGRIISVQDVSRRVASLEAFIAKAPSQLITSAQLELAASAVELGDFAKAAAAYEKVIAAEGDSPLAFTARLNLAQSLMQTGDFAGARVQLETALSDAPANVKAALYQMLAETAEAAGDKAGAEAALENALSSLAPTDQEGAAYFRARIAQLKK